MSAGGRGEARRRLLRRSGAAAAVLVLLALVLLASGHWLIGIVLGLAAAVAVWVFLQARAVR
jgi:uncharacterized membrane protein YgaE (UPF0421/DUF939 family)